MPIELTANKVANAAKEGFERHRRFRRARAMFIKDYAGDYYYRLTGWSGEYPINLIFLAIRTLVPNLVMKEGANKITTDVLAQKEYAELLGLALNKSQKQRKMKQILRAGCVDMCFGDSIFKTSIAATGELLQLEPDVNIDPGQVYTEIIDFDDFTADPLCKSWKGAAFLGHNVRIERQKLLDAPGWNHDLVRSLPSAGLQPFENNRVEDITQRNAQNLSMFELQDFVNVVELWFPEAQAIGYIANPYQRILSDFLKVDDYYGPDEGGYTFGSLTPPVPNNPFCVAPVGVWRDLNEIANRMFKKIMNQAERQKDVGLYTPAMADVAEAIAEAFDGEMIASENPEAVKVVSFGGQKTENERMVMTLRSWFNAMAGNPEQMAGISTAGRTETATEISTLQSNAAVGLQDMRDIVYDIAADISKKEAWYIHTDPLIKMPLTKRVTGDQEIQIWLTPEQRQGDWAELTFEIVKRSMNVVEPALRAKRIIEFNTNVLPAIMMAAYQAMQIGIPFNVQRAVMQAAEELGIEDAISEVFNDPTFQQRMQLFMQMGPKDAGKGQIMSPKGIAQNEGFPMKRNILTPGQDFNQQSQMGAADMQSIMQGAY